jgi:hypothetical protein
MPAVGFRDGVEGPVGLPACRVCRGRCLAATVGVVVAARPLPVRRGTVGSGREPIEATAAGDRIGRAAVLDRREMAAVASGVRRNPGPSAGRHGGGSNAGRTRHSSRRRDMIRWDALVGFGFSLGHVVIMGDCRNSKWRLILRRAQRFSRTEQIGGKGLTPKAPCAGFRAGANLCAFRWRMPTKKQRINNEAHADLPHEVAYDSSGVSEDMMQSRPERAQRPHRNPKCPRGTRPGPTGSTLVAVWSLACASG